MSSPRLLTGLLLLVALPLGAPWFAPAPPAERVLLETDADGRVVAGSLAELNAAVRRGAALRVGWELGFRLPDQEPLQLEHWADAGFVTLWRGHVFAQLASIRVQGPALDEPAIMLDGGGTSWTAVVGSNGTLRSVFDGQSPELQQVPTRWAVRHGPGD